MYHNIIIASSSIFTNSIVRLQIGYKANMLFIIHRTIQVTILLLIKIFNLSRYKFHSSSVPIEIILIELLLIIYPFW